MGGRGFRVWRSGAWSGGPRIRSGILVLVLDREAAVTQSMMPAQMGGQIMKVCALQACMAGAGAACQAQESTQAAMRGAKVPWAA